MRKLLFLAIVIVFAGTFLAVGCGQRPSAQAQQKALYYCPMHPQYTSDHPGDCPICNMKLVKKQADPRPQSAAASMPEPAQSSKAVPRGKPADEICVEHNCTHKDCPMQIRAQLKPGERIICPVCGEYIVTGEGSLVKAGGSREGGKKAFVAPSVQKQQVSKKKRILFYRNPMDPKITSPVPMKDQMGMEYVPVYEDDRHAASTGVKISPEKQQLIGVKTEIVKELPLTRIIRASGTIAYDPELFVTQEEFVQALLNEDRLRNSPLQEVIDRAQSLTEAARRKLRLLGMSEEQISQLAKDRKVDTNLYLPKSGENVWAYVAIYEYEIADVKAGQGVELEALAYPGAVFYGKVVALNPVLDSATRSNQVRISVLNGENKLKPQMYVTAKIKVDLGNRLAVPESAVLDTGIRKMVYVSREEGFLEAREVRLGQKAEGFYEVLAGVQAGDRVVTSGNFLVDSESQLQSALSGNR